MSGERGWTWMRPDGKPAAGGWVDEPVCNIENWHKYDKENEVASYDYPTDAAVSMQDGIKKAWTAFDAYYWEISLCHYDMNVYWLALHQLADDLGVDIYNARAEFFLNDQKVTVPAEQEPNNIFGNLSFPERVAIFNNIANTTAVWRVNQIYKA